MTTIREMDLIEPIVIDTVNALVPEEQFKRLFSFVKDQKTLHHLFLYMKYQLKSSIMAYCITHESYCSDLNKHIRESKRENKIHNSMVPLVEKLNISNLSKTVHEICVSTLNDSKQKMEVENEQMEVNDKIFALLSDTLQVSETVNAAVTEKSLLLTSW
ncbi:hypothetical protein EIN_389860 [Entamoeba invadens IP1]|uniref:Uncharacterized protein n=1 Tax=Entamoeba invadens IP1 TaxID=370355 RepID=A0A0A1UB35_ENTIV|nr:hypothetical protein EIN_389860 [Entamoeba invadens IP1]ELP89401.1 hypothetical protein EIN_389860 [Entamoeba invadens IP1]|eukprot:XP_004256172.1 hypothetical protein EIN_389860 [Entamoeba invadens IP1]